MKTIRERAVELHNSGTLPETICRALGLTLSQLETKLAQSRREGVVVRPEGMSVADFRRRAPVSQVRPSVPEPVQAAAAQAKPQESARPEVDWAEVVKAWNLDPDPRAVARQFNLKRELLRKRINALRAKGVPLRYQRVVSDIARLKAAAASVLTSQELADLTANKRRIRRQTPLHPLPPAPAPATRATGSGS